MNLKCIYFLCFAIINISLFAQSSRVLSFSGSKNSESSALLSWTMNAGSTCLSLSVQRGTDAVNFKTVYVYPSVCGSTDKEESYFWLDKDVLPYQKNYYRLKLEEGEYTLPILVDMDSELFGKDIFVSPNPSYNEVFINLRNPLNLGFKVNLFDLNGALIKTESNYFGQIVAFSLFGVKNGFYIIQVEFESGKKKESKISVLN